METSAPSAASRPTGYATIALASAAGVIAASRMSRPALMIAAGVALAWWRKHQEHSKPQAAPLQTASTHVEMPPAPSPPPEIPRAAPPEVCPAPEMQLAEVFEAPELPVEVPQIQQAPEETLAEPELSVPAAEIVAAQSFPDAPLRPDAPVTDAWNDLRAALLPTLSQRTAPTEPLPAFPESAPTHFLPNIPAPELPEMHFCEPTSPLLEAPEGLEEEPDDLPEKQTLHYIPFTSPREPSGEIPDEICLPTLPQNDSDLIVTAPEFLITVPQPREDTVPLIARNFAPPVILPRSAQTSAESADAPTASTSQPSEIKPLPSAPVVVSREVQAKKSFFDWLRS